MDKKVVEVETDDLFDLTARIITIASILSESKDEQYLNLSKMLISINDRFCNKYLEKVHHGKNK